MTAGSIKRTASVPAVSPILVVRDGESFAAQQVRERLEQFSRTAGPTESVKAELMRLTLSVGVPLAVADLQAAGGPTDHDFAFCRRVALRLASQADRLQYRSRAEWGAPPESPGDPREPGRYWSSGELMTMLIQACAVLAFCPGGLTFLGLHFEVPGAPSTDPAERRRSSPLLRSRHRRGGTRRRRQ